MMGDLSDALEYLAEYRGDDIEELRKFIQGQADRIEQLEASTIHAKWKSAMETIEQLQAAITNFREGNYPHPRTYRPNQCPHKKYYYEDCGDCDEEYWQSVFPEEKDDG